MRLLVTTRGTVVTNAAYEKATQLDGADILIENGQISRIESSRNLIDEFDAT